MAIQIDVKNEIETDILGGVLVKTLPQSLVVTLSGPLGAGKTRLVQAIASASGVPLENIGSPTFVLVKEYQGEARTIYHFDAYRLRNSDEFFELGADEYFDANALSFVEWAEKVQDAVPDDRLDISIQPIDETSRRFTLATRGDLDSKLENEILEQWIRATK